LIDSTSELYRNRRRPYLNKTQSTLLTLWWKLLRKCLIVVLILSCKAFVWGFKMTFCWSS